MLPKTQVATRKSNPLISYATSAISRFKQSFVALLIDPPKPSPEQEKQHKEADEYLKLVRDKSYRFSDVLFKSISWLGLIVVLDGLRDATGYGLFYILEAIAILSFMTFAFWRLVYPVAYLIRFLGVGSGQVRAWFAAIIISIPLCGIGYGTAVIVPVVIKKIVYVQRCAGSSVSNPIKGCPTVKKHSSLLPFR